MVGHRRISVVGENIVAVLGADAHTPLRAGFADGFVAAVGVVGGAFYEVEARRTEFAGEGMAVFRVEAQELVDAVAGGEFVVVAAQPVDCGSGVGLGFVDLGVLVGHG